ncbi:MAG: phage tail protein [Desulfarculaceae bacterium]|nr:phage tail protein [Desulfarculaceae bacterium]MCF8064447.1 phage tail protein [Desulfarculaceae bacterium]MCF8098484.1 phage tail protein [Desulfarculaceae bacterium]MCF8122305.1 phage tail protein [Desulfarculaceae bacterium]
MPRRNQDAREADLERFGTVTAKANMAQLAEIDRALKGIKNGVPKSMMRAINHTIGPTKTLMLDIVKKWWDVKVTRNRVKAYFIHHMATIQNTVGEVIAEGPPLPAIYFSPKPATNKRWLRGTKKRTNPPAGGVSVNLPHLGRVSLPGTFIVLRARAWPMADDRNQPKYHVVERVGRKRMPIRIVHGPGMGELVGPHMDEVLLQTEKRLSERWHREAERLLETV